MAWEAAPPHRFLSHLPLAVVVVVVVVVVFLLFFLSFFFSCRAFLLGVVFFCASSARVDCKVQVYRVFTEFYWFFSKWYEVTLDCIGYYSVLLSFTGFYRILLGFHGFY